jgi:hypothetical protein
MLDRIATAASAVAALLLSMAPAHAFDEAKYPDLKGQWTRSSPVQWDPTKPPGRGQQAPLTAEYQAIHDAALAEQVTGGQEYNPQVRCIPPGLPRMMIAYEPMEIMITPETTYLMLVYITQFRRIYTDGRSWPKTIEPTFTGYSIGKWIDETGSGRYNVLEVETRGFKGPRVFDNTGIPLHKDNQTVIKERISLDNADPNTLRNEITTIDHALTRPWTVTRTYHREAKPAWSEYICAENNKIIIIGKESYFV